MNYFGPDQLPVYAVLANEFGICDRWYTSHAGPTWPNRFVLFTGDLNLDPLGNVEQDNPDLITMLPIKAPTLFDHLNDRDVSWKLFENGYSFIRLYRNYTFDTTNVVWFDDPVHGFEAAARAGTLPQVTMIEPDYIDLPPGNDDHPPADMANGQDLINRVVKALLASPSGRRRCSSSPTTSTAASTTTRSRPPTRHRSRGGRTNLGPRVPAFLVSPWIKRRDVIHTRFDHTSIGATILRRFAGLTPPPSVSERLDAATDLRDGAHPDRTTATLRVRINRAPAPRSSPLVRPTLPRRETTAHRPAGRQGRLPLAAVGAAADRGRGAAVRDLHADPRS